MTKCTERGEGGEEGRGGGEAEGDRPRQIPSHANYNNKRQEKGTMTAGAEKLHTSRKTRATVTKQGGKKAKEWISGERLEWKV